MQINILQFGGSVAENFFSSLKNELVDDDNYESHAEATASIAEYIDGFYKPVRKHSHLGYNNPIEFELKSSKVAILAAQSDRP